MERDPATGRFKRAAIDLTAFCDCMRLYVFRGCRQVGMPAAGRELTDRIILASVSEYMDDMRISRDVRPTEMKVERDARGKPSVVFEGGEGIHISPSHSGDVCACLVSRANAGLDIQFRRKADFGRIGDRFFTGEESEMIGIGGEDAFFRLWTRKEAYSKFTGRGMEDIISGKDVLHRDDVEFEDMMLEDGLYCCCCIGI